MKLKDLDSETRLVIHLARIVSQRPTIDNLKKLKSAVEQFQVKHELEMAENLLAALFPKNKKGGRHA